MTFFNEEKLLLPEKEQITLTVCWMAGSVHAMFVKAQQPYSFTPAWPAWAVMAFRMTGIAPAAAMVTLLALFAARFVKARQPCSFTPACVPYWCVLHGMVTKSNISQKLRKLEYQREYIHKWFDKNYQITQYSASQLHYYFLFHLGEKGICAILVCIHGMVTKSLCKSKTTKVEVSKRNIFINGLIRAIR